jgi:hypothetical protein
MRLSSRIRCCLTIAVASLVISGCIAGTTGSGTPIYPANWPAIVPTSGHACPRLTGTYAALSEQAAPLVYRPGGRPQEKFMFVPIGPPEPTPALGRRLLPWHLAGEFDETSEIWKQLKQFSIQASVDGNAGAVDVRELPDGVIQVRVLVNQQPFLQFDLHEGQRHWTYAPQRYECRSGALIVHGSFLPPQQENPIGAPGGVAVVNSFYAGVDGSLLMLEVPVGGSVGQDGLFQKWWRWRKEHEQ